MSDKSVFSDEEWHALTDAPLLIAMAMAAVGPHGPISMLKESTAAAKALGRPADHAGANVLIAEIAEVARGKEARHDAKHHKAGTLPATIDLLLEDLPPAAVALGRLPADESAAVADWFAEIARAIAAASKGTSPEEQAVVDRIVAIFAT